MEAFNQSLNISITHRFQRPFKMAIIHLEHFTHL